MGRIGKEKANSTNLSINRFIASLVSMSQPRRSQRIAAKAASKPVPFRTSAAPFPRHTGAGQGGKSSLTDLLREFFPHPRSGWHLDYPVLQDDEDINNPQVVQKLIEDHEHHHQWDAHHAEWRHLPQWEGELMVSARWLCVDNRLLKASPEMRAKAEKHAWRVNDSFPALYAQIECLKKQLPTLKGVAADRVHYHLLESNLLLQLADHVHQKWNIVMHELEDEERQKAEAEAASEEPKRHLDPSCGCSNFACVKNENCFKPEMPLDSDSDSDSDW